MKFPSNWIFKQTRYFVSAHLMLSSRQRIMLIFKGIESCYQKKDLGEIMIDQRTQKGASAVGLLITLALIGYACYVGVQYVPQRIEFTTVESILSNIEQNHRKTRYNDSQEVQRAIGMQLNLNVMDDMKDNFRVRQIGSEITVEVAYERELNLLYEQKKLQYAEALTLR